MLVNMGCLAQCPHSSQQEAQHSLQLWTVKLHFTSMDSTIHTPPRGKERNTLKRVRVYPPRQSVDLRWEVCVCCSLRLEHANHANGSIFWPICRLPKGNFTDCWYYNLTPPIKDGTPWSVMKGTEKFVSSQRILKEPALRLVNTWNKNTSFGLDMIVIRNWPPYLAYINP